MGSANFKSFGFQEKMSIANEIDRWIFCSFVTSTANIHNNHQKYPYFYLKIQEKFENNKKSSETRAQIMFRFVPCGVLEGGHPQAHSEIGGG